MAEQATEQEITATVAGFDFKGRGRLCAQSGERLRALPKTIPGDVVAVSLALDGKVSGWSLRSPGPLRLASPGCEQDAACPGCQWRSLPLSEQRLQREAAWRLALARLAQSPISSEVWRPSVPAVASDHYRAKAVGRWFPDLGVIGMLALPAKQPQSPVNLALCPTQTRRTQKTLRIIAHVLSQCGLAAYDKDVPNSVSGIYYITVDAPISEGIVRVMFVTPSAPDARLRRASEMLNSTDQNLSIWHGKISLRDPVMPHRNLAHLGGPAAMNVLDVQGKLLRASPGAWTSTSPQNAGIVWRALSDAITQAQTPDDSRFLEIGCGVGVHSFALAALAPGGFVGVDSSREAILDAQWNAAQLGVDPGKVQFRVGEADHTVRRLIAGRWCAPRVVLHGMREPFGVRLCGALPALGVVRLWYITPSVFALGEDLRGLLAAGFRLRSIVPLDTMPHTYHMMALAELERAV